MRIVGVRERTVPISRYATGEAIGGDLDTTAVAVVTDVLRDGEPIVGFGFSSVGRFGQGGLIRDRFAPRLLAAADEVASAAGDNIDPFRAWDRMMRAEKPGGHGERCVAVGTLDMALWDAAAKIADRPLHAFLTHATGASGPAARVPVYAGGGYYFPEDDVDRLTDEVRGFLDQGHTHVKIKIGGRTLGEDLERIEAVLAVLPSADRLAVDAMNRYDPDQAVRVACALAPYGLRWFEDVCDPLDFAAHARIAEHYAPPLAAGEALFSAADAQNLARHGGLRPDRDVLVFDPAHCYGLPGFLQIVQVMEAAGWGRGAFQPHGGHLFSLHIAAALGLGGSEANPHNFQPFGGFADAAVVEDGHVRPPDAPGIGFETRSDLFALFRSLL
ncbi:L-alanine-DL-glutamate epimerase-like enolase superfamily enzyme [Pseudonocardia hierapolitana]|uniref:L-alanine-DL-glutamate epimerase-like enolase superfamily enzyme n=1 Tax=Pseudonocardia hierapolitana TaxID=1128676 RepID=A0A561SRF5_9PSEU|nr:enolase C-terminal domain-like protein [Pseudonocardia hierapolitana]TWF77433.1 L-alanine-DL-glutamate epimerase-like enolase superfamily enzyme [Pseudonocardia hierapolitana]